MKPVKCDMCGSSEFKYVDGKYVCEYCGSEYTEDDSGRPVINLHGDIYINNAGTPGQTVRTSPAAARGRTAGAQSANSQKANSRVFEQSKDSPKSWGLTLGLAILFGYFGFHRFYAGKFWTGLLWLFTLGFFGLGWIVDIIYIATGKFTDKDKRYIRRKH